MEMLLKIFMYSLELWIAISQGD